MKTPDVYTNSVPGVRRRVFADDSPDFRLLLLGDLRLHERAIHSHPSSRELLPALSYRGTMAPPSTIWS